MAALDVAKVTLHIYDISMGNEGSGKSLTYVNTLLRPLGTGAFHAGVEVHGEEWSYGYVEGEGSGVYMSPEVPGCCSMYKHREAVDMGETTLTREEVSTLILSLAAEWQGRKYDLLRKNCSHFSDALCRELGVDRVPMWVTRLAGAGATLSDASAKAGAAAGSAAAKGAAVAGKIDGRFNISEKVTAASIIAAAKANEIDEQYRVRGTTKALAVDMLSGTKRLAAAAAGRAQELDEQYHIRSTAAAAATKAADAAKSGASATKAKAEAFNEKHDVSGKAAAAASKGVAVAASAAGAAARGAAAVKAKAAKALEDRKSKTQGTSNSGSL